MSPSPARVLVVDDEPVVLKIAQRVLTREDIEVSTAADGKGALEALAGGDIDLVLLDSNLPDINAERVLELMRERDITTPVLISSGFGAGLPTAEDFPNVRGFLAKPYSVVVLRDRVRELLGLD